MVTDEVPALARAVFTEMLVDGDDRAALDVARGLRARGVTTVDLATHLVAPALEAVGRRWQQNTVSVAVEHRATAIAEGVLQELVAGADSRAVPLGRVLLTGVEGEWHTMPARIVAAVWRVLQWDVFALTPSLPADELTDLVRHDTSGIAAVSCSLPGNLLAAWQTIGVLRAAGLRVLVGGRAFDAHPGLAEQLGADAHRLDPLSGHEVLLAWTSLPPLPSRAAVALPGIQEVAEVWHQIPQMVPAIMTLAEELSGVRMPGPVLQEDLQLLVRTALSAAALNRTEVFTGHVVWYREVLAANRADPRTADVLVDALGRVLPADAERVRSVLAG